ncbi:hypothetical protein BD780_003431 [Clostridium tetanomorphum]|nr:hypothetical protein [Clostridium tetanomorphum]MBP1863630.1 hypothetical protein [Clostridium tetanomorphum]NRS86206.1 hypothetical protein [Clostridium tetanomorphum]NRZ95715.1 hypothetical protein [Clostridium tetanomorphum]
MILKKFYNFVLILILIVMIGITVPKIIVNSFSSSSETTTIYK